MESEKKLVSLQHHSKDELCEVALRSVVKVLIRKKMLVKSLYGVFGRMFMTLRNTIIGSPVPSYYNGYNYTVRHGISFNEAVKWFVRWTLMPMCNHLTKDEEYSIVLQRYVEMILKVAGANEENTKCEAFHLACTLLWGKECADSIMMPKPSTSNVHAGNLNWESIKTYAPYDYYTGFNVPIDTSFDYRCFLGQF